MFKRLFSRKNQEISQLSMDMPEGSISPVTNFKSYIKNMEYKISVVPYWRNGFIWLSFIGILFCGLTAVTMVAFNFNNIPPQLPLLYKDSNNSWSIVSKEFLIFVPLIIAVCSMALFYLFPKLFYINKRLTISLALCLFFANFALAIAVIELIFMVIN